MIMKLAFLGLGVMGFPMAGHLSQSGFDITVYNRTSKKSEHWLQTYQGSSASTPSEAVRAADIVFACVSDDNSLRDITLGDLGAYNGMKPGAVFVDHSSVSAEVTRELAGLAKNLGLSYLDAPVSGGQQGAENGELTIMVGGDEKDFSSVKPVIALYAREVALMGPVGNGQLCKMVNQICVAGLIQGLAEGLNFAEAAGLDVEQVIHVISKGAAQSWQMENRYKTMIAGEYHHGFAVDLMRKDLAIAMKEASLHGAKLPVTELVDQYYSDVQDMSGNHWDTSSLLARLKLSNE
jgi:3-hydroxyisobutyrate dehydrogenase-like beta-hydroxyacid dehydrogenase